MSSLRLSNHVLSASLLAASLVFALLHSDRSAASSPVTLLSAGTMTDAPAMPETSAMANHPSLRPNSLPGTKIEVTGTVEELILSANGSVAFRVRPTHAKSTEDEEMLNGDVWFRAGSEGNANTRVEIQILMALLDRPREPAVTVFGERDNSGSGKSFENAIPFTLLRLRRASVEEASSTRTTPLPIK